MARTLDQQIAQMEAQLARLKQKGRSVENGQKIILGGLLLNAVRRDPRQLDWLLDEVAQHVTREVDQKRLAPLLDELRGKSMSLKVP